MNEKDANVDHISTLKYIQGAMLHSRLNEYLDTQTQSTQNPQWSLVAEEGSLFELYKKGLGGIKSNVPQEMRLPGLDTLIRHLSEQFDLVFARIAETQRRNVRFGSIIPLGIHVPSSVDMRMISGVSKWLKNVSLAKLILVLSARKTIKRMHYLRCTWPN